MTEQLPIEFPCQVEEIINHGNRDYSLILKPESPAPRFLPGQFLKLALDNLRPREVWSDSRSFSIASPPELRETLRITYAVKGQFTTRMEAELRPGSRVWVQMPFGQFSISTGKDVCLLAGGTGVTAFTAFLAGLTESYPQQVYLFYGVRHPHLLIYRPLVEAARITCPELHVYYLAEKDFTANDCLEGRIEVETVWNLVPDPFSLTYYLAGPPGMITSLRGELELRGIPPRRIKADAWDRT